MRQRTDVEGAAGALRLWMRKAGAAAEAGREAELGKLSLELAALVAALADAEAAEAFREGLRAAVDGVGETLDTLGGVAFSLGMPDEAAALMLDARQAVAAKLGSKEWAAVPWELRDAAFFSARVESLDALRGMQARLATGMAGNGPTMDPERFVRDTRRDLEQLGVTTVPPGQGGGIRDIRSRSRLRLVAETQTDMARNYASRRAGFDPDILDAVPAWRFRRMRPAKVPRPEGYWAGQWAQAGESIGWAGALRSPMAALKTSPIWAALGALGPFGNPYAPFNYRSQWGQADMGRDEAERIGLLKPDEEVQPPKDADEPFTRRLSAQGLTFDAAEALRSEFGDQVQLAQDGERWMASWRPPSQPYRTAADLGKPDAYELAKTAPYLSPSTPGLADRVLYKPVETWTQDTQELAMGLYRDSTTGNPYGVIVEPFGNGKTRTRVVPLHEWERARRGLPAEAAT